MILRPLPIAALLLGGVITPGGTSAQAADVLYSFDFDEGESGFITDDSTWRRWYVVDVAQGNLGNGLEDGPGRDKAWGSNPLGQYPSDLDIELLSPILDLGAADAPTLELWHRYDTQVGGDGGQLCLGSGDTRRPLLPWGGYPGVMQGVDGLPTGAFTGSSEGWGRSFFDLSDLSPSELEDAILGFHFHSNGTLGDTGWFIERLIIYEGDGIPPLIQPIVTPETKDDYLSPSWIEVVVEENERLVAVDLDYRVGIDGEMVQLPLGDLGEGRFGGEIPAQLPGTTVFYRVVADDEANNSGRLPNVVATPGLSPFAEFSIEVKPPQGLALQEVPPRITTEVGITWERPVTEMPISAYHIYRSAGASVPVTLSPGESRTDAEDAPPAPLSQEAVVDTLSLSIPLEEENRVSTLVSSEAVVDLNLNLEGGTGEYVAVTAVYELPDGGTYESVASELLTLDVAVPSVSSLEPGLGYQGQSLVVTVVGKNTDFSQGQVAIDFGPGVQVQLIDVLDVTRLRATLWIEEMATVGEREVTLTVNQAPRGRGMFRIAPASEQPAITSVVPPRATQGQALQVKFEANGTEFVGNAPTVDFGVGVLVVGSAVLSDDGGSFTLPIQVEASCPVGERTIIVKTEGQVFTDVPFEIRPGGQALDFGCSHTGGEGPASWALAGVLGLLLRRRRF